ncbi:MAG: NADH-quinone oxidoreductase subunit J, partial [Tepidisphaeraceae bacterium]
FEAKLGEVVIAVSIAAVLMMALTMGIMNRYGSPEAPPEVAQTYPIYALGQALLGDYLIPFEVVSVLLLVVMIGAAYLAKARRPEQTPTSSTTAASAAGRTTR